MARPQEICPHCQKMVDAELLERADSSVCPHCLHSMSETPERPLAAGSVTPSEPGKEIPELSPSQGNIRLVQSVSLFVFLATMAVGISLAFQIPEGNVDPVQLMMVAVVALLTLFIWAYTQFAMNLKSGPR